MSMRTTVAMVCCLGVGVLLARVPALNAQEPAPNPAAEMFTPDIPGVVKGGIKIQLVKAGFKSAEGPIRTDDGGVLFSEHHDNKLRKIDKDGNITVFAEDTKFTAGLAYSKGRLVGTALRHPGLLIFTPSRSVLVESYKGQHFVAPNDLAANRKGGIYFTDPILNTTNKVPPGRTPAVFYLPPDGELIMASTGVERPNGIVLSPDDKILYVANREFLVAFDIQPDGTLSNQRNFAKYEGRAANGGPLGADGIVVDSEGRVYAASGGGMQIFSPQGKYLGMIKTPVGAQNAAFAGPDLKTLWVTGQGAVFKIPMIAQGIKDRAR